MTSSKSVNRGWSLTSSSLPYSSPYENSKSVLHSICRPMRIKSLESQRLYQIDQLPSMQTAPLTQSHLDSWNRRKAHENPLPLYGKKCPSTKLRNRSFSPRYSRMSRVSTSFSSLTAQACGQISATVPLSPCYQLRGPLYR